MSHPTPNVPLKIAIIGGGPGGLCLANIFLENNIPCTVFESDTSPNQRNQGGTLDIHPAFGQKALRAAGLWQEFLQHARPEADVMKLVNQISGEVLWDGNTKDKVDVPENMKYNHRPELDREVLQDMLLEKLQRSGCIQWNKRLQEVVAVQNDQYDLHFKDGSTEHGVDLVVGADGAWSHTRRILTDAMPYYSGITGVEFRTYNVDTKNPWLSKYVGAGSLFSFNEGRAVQIQRIGNGTMRAYACIRKPESFFKESGIQWDSRESIERDFLDVYFADVADDLKKALHGSDDVTCRQLFMLPVGFSWESKPGVTLLGDAAHLMTPFAGVGVNAALVDAYELGTKIVDFVKTPEARSLGDVTKAYDEQLFPRGEMFAKKTYSGLVGHFSMDGNKHFLRRLRIGTAAFRVKIAIISGLRFFGWCGRS